MPVSYTVKQGDHLSSIAKAYGFSDYETIWNDPNNAELKQLREDPNVLFPGDVVYIPDRELRVEARATEVRHKFVKHGKAIKIRLVLEDLFEKPIANAPCDLILGTETFHVFRMTTVRSSTRSNLTSRAACSSSKMTRLR